MSRKCDFFHTAATASGRRRRESCNTLIAIQGKSRKRPLSIDYDTMMHFEIEFLVATPLLFWLVVSTQKTRPFAMIVGVLRYDTYDALLCNNFEKFNWTLPSSLNHFEI